MIFLVLVFAFFMGIVKKLPREVAESGTREVCRDRADEILVGITKKEDTQVLNWMT